MTSYPPIKPLKLPPCPTSESEFSPKIWLGFANSSLRHPALVVSLGLATAETVPSVYYGRYLARLDLLPAALSVALSFAGTVATYLFIIEVASRRAWLKRMVIAGVAIWTLLLQLIFFGIYCEFSTLPMVSVVDFVRQAPGYAWALFVDRLDLVVLGASALAIGAVVRGLRWGFDAPLRTSRSIAIGLGFLVLASYRYTRAPFMTFGQQIACLVFKSLDGPGTVNVEWTPDRALVPPTRAKYPVNVVVFRLEEIAAQATTLERPELPTMPELKALVDEHPNEVFVAAQHFANSTATDVSVLSIYTGLSPAADLEAHRRIPTLWDYFAAAGYDTSMFIPFHLEWGDFKRRFNARPDELHLSKLMDAGNSGFPLVYDDSINDTDVIMAALDYQRRRGWQQPFLQIVSLKMPHAIGEGARVNKLDYGDWGSEPEDLKDYYNGIRHDDDLMHRFMDEMPVATKDRTVFVILSDHGTRLFARTDGVEELHRLDNYHQETTRIPFVIYMPQGTQRIVPAEKVQALRVNLAARATSNIDLVPTVVGISGITPVDTNLNHAALILGRDLSQPQPSTEAIVQLNTGPLRRWDREHFALLLDNGRYHYLFSMGRELLFDRHADPREESNLITETIYRGAVDKARTIIAEVPELLRIQQKYPARGERSSGSGAATNANLLGVSVDVAGVVRLKKSPDAPAREVAEFTVPAGLTSTTTTEFVIRGKGGDGGLEWRLRRGPNLTHFVHVDRVSAGHSHRLVFRWHPPAGNELPLSVVLHGEANSKEFDFSIEKAVTHADPASFLHANLSRELEILALASHEDAAEITTSYPLDRFTQHPCLKEMTVQDCPNGYLVWGPYVNSPKGMSARLRYDIQVTRRGVNAWLDLSVEAGQSPIAQSRVYRLEEAGVHTFEFHARLGDEGKAVEGRLNAFAGAGLKDYPIAIENAELTLLRSTR
jgi:hypothetical protein